MGSLLQTLYKELVFDKSDILNASEYCSSEISEINAYLFFNISIIIALFSGIPGRFYSKHGRVV